MPDYPRPESAEYCKRPTVWRWPIVEVRHRTKMCGVLNCPTIGIIFLWWGLWICLLRWHISIECKREVWP